MYTGCIVTKALTYPPFNNNNPLPNATWKNIFKKQPCFLIFGNKKFKYVPWLHRLNSTEAVTSATSVRLHHQQLARLIISHTCAVHSTLPTPKPYRSATSTSIRYSTLVHTPVLIRPTFVINSLQSLS